MKRWMKIVFCVTFSFLFCFLCVGYAKVTDTLTIDGMANASEPQTVYITEIVSTTGTVTEAELVPYTSVDSTITLGSAADSTVVMTIRVKNNTTVRYGYNAIRYAAEAYSNSTVAVSTNMTRKLVDSKGNVVKEGTVIEPGKTVEFQAIFSYAGADTSRPTLTSIINYEFLPWDSITADVDAGLAEDVMDQFEDILNNEDIPDSYQKLLDQMAKNEEADRIYDDYIANFDEAYSVDKEVLAELFGTDILKMTIDGKEMEVKVMIKRKNVTDAYAGDEMVLYMTTHTLKKSDATRTRTGFNGWLYGTWYYAGPVYAAVFSVDQTSGEAVWRQIGDMYVGDAIINGYDGGAYGDGSFNTESWASTKKYGSAASGSDINKVIDANT